MADARPRPAGDFFSPRGRTPHGNTPVGGRQSSSGSTSSSSQRRGGGGGSSGRSSRGAFQGRSSGDFFSPAGDFFSPRGRTPHGNTPVGGRQSSSGSTSSSSQRRGGGGGSSGHGSRGAFQGRSSGSNHPHRQEYRPKTQPIESQNVQNVNALVSNFEVEDTMRGGGSSGRSSSGAFQGRSSGSNHLHHQEYRPKTQPIESQNVQNVNALVSNFEVEDTMRGDSGESLSLDGLSIAASTQCEEKCVEDEEKRESSEAVMENCFDICLPKEGSCVVLKASLFQKNKQRRNEMKRSYEGQKSFVLRPGMVLLKNYLSISEQINIVNRCRELGLGAGGFYQPGYRDGGRLNLKMMCLGKHWDPDTSIYGEYRPSDNAKPPVIPPEFQLLVEKSIEGAHSLIERTSKASNVKGILPSMSPNICIMNFYSLTGQLGLHQDKDESKESISKGLPVVSFSIGESAEFLYGDHRDVERAEKVTLESGDVLIFGGKSRHIFHGVSSIQKETAPITLLDKTSLRPGRLNLTFRQY